MNMEGISSKFVYSRAVVSHIPSSLPEAALRLDESGESVDLEKARRQHVAYVLALKQLGLSVTELAEDESYPDCVFVEDAAVVCEGTALMARLGHPSRRGEVDRMKTALESLGLKIVLMEEPALLDGGDVLFTGREFLVGLSTRTNQDGVEVLAKTFPSYPVTAITVKEHLHLKSMMTMAGPDRVVVGESEEAKGAWVEVQANAKFEYEKISVPEDKAANCLYINGCLVHLPHNEVPASSAVFTTLVGRKIALENSELSKVDGCLTCLSILIH